MPVNDVSGDHSQCAAQISETVTPGVRRFVYVAYQCDWSEDICIRADDSITCRKSHGRVKMMTTIIIVLINEIQSMPRVCWVTGRQEAKARG